MSVSEIWAGQSSLHFSNFNINIHSEMAGLLLVESDLYRLIAIMVLKYKGK